MNLKNFKINSNLKILSVEQSFFNDVESLLIYLELNQKIISLYCFSRKNILFFSYSHNKSPYIIKDEMLKESDIFEELVLFGEITCSCNYLKIDLEKVEDFIKIELLYLLQVYKLKNKKKPSRDFFLKLFFLNFSLEDIELSRLDEVVEGNQAENEDYLLELIELKYSS